MRISELCWFIEYKTAFREELENSKIINVKKEFTVKEETTEGIEEDYQNQLQRGEYMELETKGIKKVKNEEDYQIEQEKVHVELETELPKRGTGEKRLQNNFNRTFSKPPPPTSLSDLPDLPLEIIVRYLSGE